MQNLAKGLTLVLITVAGIAQAIDSEPTARPKAVAPCVQCETPAPQSNQPAIDVAPPAPVPGLSASIQGAVLADMKSEKLESETILVHGFKKELAVKEFAIKVPFEYSVTVPYVVEVTRPVQMSGTYEVTRNNYVPVTNTYSVPYKYCDPCKGWVSGTTQHTQTTMVNRPYVDSVQYNYTKNITEQKVRERTETRVGLKDGTDTKVVEIVVPTVEEYKKMKTRTTLVYETTAITPVINGK